MKKNSKIKHIKKSLGSFYHTVVEKAVATNTQVAIAFVLIGLILLIAAYFKNFQSTALMVVGGTVCTCGGLLSKYGEKIFINLYSIYYYIKRTKNNVNAK